LIYKYQTDLGKNKLVISRSDGRLFFDDAAEREKHNINLISDLFDVDREFEKKESEFGNLILSVPQIYLRSLPETRFDNPYVVQITEAGVAYVRKGL